MLCTEYPYTKKLKFKMMTPKNRTRVSKLYENALHGMRLNGNQKFTAIESGEAEHVV